MQLFWGIVLLVILGVLYVYWKVVIILLFWACFIASCVYAVRMFLVKQKGEEESEFDYKAYKEKAIGFWVGCLLALLVGSCGFKLENNDQESEKGVQTPVQTPVQTVTSQWQCGNCSRIVSKTGNGEPPAGGCPKGNGRHLWLRMK